MIESIFSWFICKQNFLCDLDEKKFDSRTRLLDGMWYQKDIYVYIYINQNMIIIE